ncbi:DUF2510 domain-containing protein [Actinoplanes sp. NPDC023714]|uniref:DUF2510 domain-containing protein n=1 Tax=Actinoplanes sp. NPDC023714 TaxID=3154322 RepID=UPI0033FA84F7
MTASGAPAGWYADPHGLPALRWWDGREWTSHIQPGAPATPPAAPFPSVPFPAGPFPAGPFPAAPFPAAPFPAAPTGTPLPGSHVEAPGAFVPTPAEPAAAPSITAPSGRAQQQAFAGYSMQPVDAVSAQLGYTTPATPQPPRPSPATDPAPRNRAVVVGAVSLLINPLLLCSIYAIALGLRALPDDRRNSTLAIALGGSGVLTHVALVLLLMHLLGK